MRIRRALKAIAALPLLLSWLAASSPALAQRSSPPAKAAAPTGLGRAYVPDLFGGLISVIDLTTNKVVDTIQDLPFPSVMAASPDGTKLYVVFNEMEIGIIDPATNTVTGGCPARRRT